MYNNKIFSINGPVIKVKNTSDFFMTEMVYVGEKKIIGEVISITNLETTIQVYENTAGLKPGEPVLKTSNPLCVTLGPGIISNIFDGIERPLVKMAQQHGSFIEIGSNLNALDEEIKYDVTPTVKEGDLIKPGEVYATCYETSVILHKCLMAPNLKEGIVKQVKPAGKYAVTDVIVTVETKTNETYNLTLAQKWPIRLQRPVKKRLKASIPLITGQRIIDTMFPIAKGGTAAIPGGFGAGKTQLQHQLAKWSDADIIIYIGCGERGNEITQVLSEFSSLMDPKTNKPLTERTTLIANTSNMPVAAREASIYTGITIAEYYRDMGYDVALMADSTSRWAEALREISGRLEEMPAEEGFPSYLPSRLSQFYERAGRVETFSGQKGSITVIGAVSPQGSDFSEPVTQNTKRFVRCFWALDKNLAYSRHFPAVNWIESYSDYSEELKPYYKENIGEEFLELKNKISEILAKEADLIEIVKLIGEDVLPDNEKLIIETAKTIRAGFLQQNAYHKLDSFVSLQKQKMMMKSIVYLYNSSLKLIEKNIPISIIINSGIFNKISRIKFDVEKDSQDSFNPYFEEINSIVQKNLI